MAKILLTRPQEASQKIAQNLAKKNLLSLIQPLFSIIQINNFQPINQKIQAVLISSSSAIFALEKLLLKKDILVFAIGEKTALEIKKLGYQNILIANNSAASLLNLALKNLSKSQGLILYLSGEIITLDIAEKLREQNFEAKRIVAYKTKEAASFSTSTIEEIKQEKIGEVWIYSKNSLRIFYKLAKKHNLLECLSRIKILCLTKEISDLAYEMNFLQTGIIKE